MEQTLVEKLRAAPLEPKSVQGYRIWEPESGWPQELMDAIVEMLRRGYDFRLVPFERKGLR